jgi:formylglycine-generating enzyme required for sulfatase activity
MTSGRPSSPFPPPERRTATFLLRQSRQVQGFREPLAEGLSLTMLWISPGRFWMGSPKTEPERQDTEGPQHLVQLPGFFMGQTPITQLQWRVVAGWEPPKGQAWQRELDPAPSAFQLQSKYKSLLGGSFALLESEENTDLRPVENVSWDDAMEFCRRLNSRLGPTAGRTYTLPSEAQWEYACRGGTTTPFAFGETLTAELANYDASTTYANGPKGERRGQTTPVGMFPANAWGLLDMHGNVWEWCLDEWHESYEGAPEDGRTWRSTRRKEGEGDESPSAKDKESSGSSRRLLRGGSWFRDPGFCRSAYRFHDRPGLASNAVGFRVVCLPQGPSLLA